MSRLMIAPRERRTVVVGATIMIALVTIARGLPALRAWEARTQASAAELASEAARATASATFARVVAESLAIRATRLAALTDGMIVGETRAVAAGELVSLLTTAASEAGVRVQSVQAMPDSAMAGTFWRLTARASVAGDVAGVTTLLLALEAGATPLAVRDLVIAQPEPAAGDDRPEALRMEFVVEAPARAGQSAGPEGEAPAESERAEATPAGEEMP